MMMTGMPALSELVLLPMLERRDVDVSELPLPVVKGVLLFVAVGYPGSWSVQVHLGNPGFDG